MACKANPQHLKLINRLKRVKKYSQDSLCIGVETWSFHESKSTTTKVTIWSSRLTQTIFRGSTISELERFINSEREKAGLFKPRDTRLKGEMNWMKEESKYMRKGGKI